MYSQQHQILRFPRFLAKKKKRRKNSTDSFSTLKGFLFSHFDEEWYYVFSQNSFHLVASIFKDKKFFRSQKVSKIPPKRSLGQKRLKRLLKIVIHIAQILLLRKCHHFFLAIEKYKYFSIQKPLCAVHNNILHSRKNFGKIKKNEMSKKKLRAQAGRNFDSFSDISR